MSRWLKLIVAVVAVWLCTATTTASAATFAYDVPTFASVHVHLAGGDDVAESEFTAAREGSVSLAADARGTSTTLVTLSNATEAAGGSLDSSVVYRYVSEGEANAAAKVGRVPNTDVLGQPRSVFYSPDNIDSVAEAERSLQIGAMNPGGATASPGFRITASPQGAQWTYGGNVAGGSGIEMLTDQALKVLRIDRLPR